MKLDADDERLVEFIEDLYGIKLLDCQKERLIKNMKDTIDCKFIRNNDELMLHFKEPVGLIDI